MLGFLASSEVNPLIAATFQKNGVAVSLAGGLHQVWNQLAGVGATVALAAIATFIILKLVDAIVGLRVDQEDESLGLDLSQHGERAYNE
jgi:Amt family ammonium transporter